MKNFNTSTTYLCKAAARDSNWRVKIFYSLQIWHYSKGNSQNWWVQFRSSSKIMGCSCTPCTPLTSTLKIMVGFGQYVNFALKSFWHDMDTGLWENKSFYFRGKVRTKRKSGRIISQWLENHLAYLFGKNVVKFTIAQIVSFLLQSSLYS